MQALKTLLGLAVFLGFCLALLTTFVVMGYVFKIICFLIAVVAVIGFLCYVGYSFVVECILKKKDKGD